MLRAARERARRRQLARVGPLLLPGETAIEAVLANTGPSPVVGLYVSIPVILVLDAFIVFSTGRPVSFWWLAVPVAISALTPLFAVRPFYLFLTDRRVLIVSASRFQGIPEHVVVDAGRGQAMISLLPSRVVVLPVRWPIWYRKFVVKLGSGSWTFRVSGLLLDQLERIIKANQAESPTMPPPRPDAD